MSSKHDTTIELFTTKQRVSKIPDFDPYWQYKRFTRKSFRNHLTPWRKISESKLQQIRNGIIAYSATHAASEVDFCKDKTVLDSVWPELSERIKNNPGLADFMMENGKNSRFFVPFILSVPNAITLEAADFRGYDLAGNFCEIPASDTMAQFCEKDKMFQWLRLRENTVIPELKKAKTVFFAGGGLLRELRSNDYPLGELDQEIKAFDIDASLQQYLKVVFPKGLEAYKIDYNFSDLRNAYAPLRNYANITIAHGILSYRKNDRELREHIHGLMSVTKPEGALYFDLQCLDLSDGTLLFDKEVLGWKTEVAMKPEFSQERANQKVYAIAEEINATVEVLHQHPIGIEYKITHKI